MAAALYNITTVHVQQNLILFGIEPLAKYVKLGFAT
jgi:hypothetical protein